MGRSPTEINGLILGSEFLDNEIYQKIRSLQFLFLHTYKMGGDLKINEIKIRRNFFYTITNQRDHLYGFVGRNPKTNNIQYMVKDWGRLRWTAAEGFDLTDENYQKIGVIAICAAMNDFILFMAGKPGYDFSGYAQN